MDKDKYVQAVEILNDSGKPVSVLKVRMFLNDDEFKRALEASKENKEADSLSLEADKANQADLDKQNALAEALLNYYSVPSLCSACDSILMDYLLGNSEATEAVREEAEACKKSSLGGGDVKDLLAANADVGSRFRDLFGLEPKED